VVAEAGGGAGSARRRQGAASLPGGVLMGAVAVEPGVEVRVLVCRGSGGGEL
jgi:hypothetical protein